MLYRYRLFNLGNFYKDITENMDYFDTSNYPLDNIHGIPQSLSVVGKMKDEFKGIPIKAFYGTGAKAYCVQTDKLMKKAKGVSKHVIKNQLNLNDYKQIVNNGEAIFRKMYVFTSEMHTVYTELRNKVALSAKDDKRFIIPNDVSTLAWGHILIKSGAGHGSLDDLIEAANDLLDKDDPEIDVDYDDLLNIKDL